ncbi:hypothetical protein LPB19_09495 [Marinobacter salinisoli]|uniref:Uncharacterized protein n=1 Tax=Marinobacter salinisoli TaxID=2769486 RepID=A0ABX7MQT5_9GAMM|nr:hypothetical protein [Marinobacter salinisoli]QSP93461.1 hypothetical protein LPB19_09495 [Marinobacter salinisoli]
MSLLTSLIRAGAQFQQALEKRPANQANARPVPSKAPDAVTGPGDDRFTPSGNDIADLAKVKSRKLTVDEYKQNVGQDLAMLRETLRHKLAEFDLHPATKLDVGKGEQGTIQLSGDAPQDKLKQIGRDLNLNKPFKEAFNRLSINEPTLHFVDNAMKLSQAYGVNNHLLETLVSDQEQFNGLQDLVHRYDNLRRSVASGPLENASEQRGYAFSLNARA